MSGFIFRPYKNIPFPIATESGEVIKEYSLNFTSEEFLRTLIDNAKKITAANFVNGDLDGIKDSIRNFIRDSFGVDDFDFLYEKFGKNFFAMIELVAVVQNEIQKEILRRKELNEKV